jgi:biotin-(acetyl-CoA carboxylase) ligase
VAPAGGRDKFLTCLEGRLDTYQAKGAAAILAAWRDLDVVTGRRVEVREGPTVFTGRALGVDTEGHLQVKDTRKRVHTVVAGEVRLIQPPMRRADRAKVLLSGRPRTRAGADRE